MEEDKFIPTGKETRIAEMMASAIRTATFERTKRGGGWLRPYFRIRRDRPIEPDPRTFTKLSGGRYMMMSVKIVPAKRLPTSQLVKRVEGKRQDYFIPIKPITPEEIEREKAIVEMAPEIPFVDPNVIAYYVDSSVADTKRIRKEYEKRLAWEDSKKKQDKAVDIVRRFPLYGFLVDAYDEKKGIDGLIIVTFNEAERAITLHLMGGQRIPYRAEQFRQKFMQIQNRYI